MVAAGEILVRLCIHNNFLPINNLDADAFYIYSVIGFSVLIIFPLSLMKNMSSFRFTSLLSVLCSMVLTVILFAQYFILCDEQSESTCFWKAGDSKNLVSGSNYSFLASFSLNGFLTSVPIFIFGCGCHPNVFPIYSEIAEESKIRKVFKCSLSISALFYLVAGSFSFMTFLNATCGNILLNDFNSSSETVIASGIFAVSLVLYVDYNNIMFPDIRF